jgi:phenylacetate-coenzyme A ligase PaaK-like adenylate-forming protein
MCGVSFITYYVLPSDLSMARRANLSPLLDCDATTPYSEIAAGLLAIPMSCVSFKVGWQHSLSLGIPMFGEANRTRVSISFVVSSLDGPLLNGATTLLFESTPVYPDEGRYWDMVQRHKITQFYTAPTAIRLLMRYGDEAPKKYDLSSLKVLGSVGEPINPEAWRWYYEVVGKSKCTVVDTYWQTETGGHIVTNIPG